MIQTKKNLQFYVAADRIMNGLPAYRGLKEKVRDLIDRPVGGVIICYLCALRHYAYSKNTTRRLLSWHTLQMVYWHRRWNKLSLKLGFSIGANSLGYGVVIPHRIMEQLLSMKTPVLGIMRYCIPVPASQVVTR